MNLLYMISVLLVGAIIVVTAIFFMVRAHYKQKYKSVVNDLEDQSSKNAPKHSRQEPTDDVVEKPQSRMRKLHHRHHLIEHKENDGWNTLSDSELFNKLTSIIRDRKLFLTQKFGRNEVVELFGLTNRRVGAAFSQGGTSLPEFVRECRLEYAQHLMAEHPELSLADVAASSGFSYITTFSADFKNKFGVSPTQYRQQMTTQM